MTVSKRSDALRISKYVVKEGLAACANVIPGVQSLYRWKGKIGSGRELLIMIKTTRKQYPALENAVKMLHPYKVPEIISVAVEAGYSQYLAWVSGKAHN